MEIVSSGGGFQPNLIFALSPMDKFPETSTETIASLAFRP
jgi:hypothetical protein